MENGKREKSIVRTSCVGIATNILLAAFKASVGIVSGSVAIVMDAINNLSDVLSSVVTIVGTKLAGRRPDKRHPMGHGRIEYISATIVALIVLMAGVAALYIAVRAIVSGKPAHYGLPSFIVMAVAVAVKIALGGYTKKMGLKLQSQSLVASGADALFDALVTSSTIISALLMVLWQVDIDGWLGVAIAIIIIKAGLSLIRGTLDNILGHRLSPKDSRDIKRAITEYDGVMGAYDLVVSDYGPNMRIGSVHIEVEENMNAREIHDLTHRMQHEIMEHNNVYLTFGIYAVSKVPTIAAMRTHIVNQLKKENDGVLQIHAFHVDKTHKTLSFDVVVSFEVRDHATFISSLAEQVHALYPDYEVNINIDTDISD